ncbi:MAG: 50S ribosomal protein L3 [Chlamydiae bacterium]|nr:50S ribosomal protein L3 [Chlamydiota bacterium]
MPLKLMGKKVGMTRIFDEKGELVVCTVIHAEPNVVSQVKTVETDGYNAIQLGFGSLSASKKKNLSKPLANHFSKKSIEPKKHLSESRVSDSTAYSVGQELSIDLFASGDFVDVTSVSKGKGYQGVIKRHNHAGGPGAHGSGFHRHGGSTGMRTTPGRTFPGMKMPGHMGDETVTVQNLKVVKIDMEKQVILVKGSVPGARGSLVTIKSAIKKAHSKKKA